METRTQDVPGYYVWEAPGKSLLVHLQLDVIDGLLSDVMRGFGAVPKRGAEVGGLLLGSIERGEQTIVRIEDFEPVECDLAERIFAAPIADAGYTQLPTSSLRSLSRSCFSPAISERDLKRCGLRQI